MASNDTDLAPARSPLSWLNYFDGRFLRAADFLVEQRAFRELVAHSNLADGFGVVGGYDVEVCGDQLRVGEGLAIDAEGRVLLLPSAVTVLIDELIARSNSSSEGAPASPSSGATASFADCVEVEVDVPHQTPEGEQLWLIIVAHGELACGTENVYGQLCASNCDLEIERPYLHETVVLRARPLALDQPYPQSKAVSLGARHLRSRVASAYFAGERRSPPPAISAAGLAELLWCRGAELAAGEVALGVLCRRGRSNLWFDAWTARRERIDEPPRRDWDHRKALRPDAEFFAQILQFQCQLAELLELAPPLARPCAGERGALVEAGASLDRLLGAWASASEEEREKFGAASLARLAQLQQAIVRAARSPGPRLLGAARILIDGGIVELPPAGYLPVEPQSELSVNAQVRRLLGDGVDPVVCVIRPDDAAMHVLGAQHDDRISLVHGLDHPDARVPIDILVPDGEFIVERPETSTFGFRVRVGSGIEPASGLGPSELLAALREATSVWMRGAGRLWTRDGLRLCLAAARDVDDVVTALWLDLRLEADPFEVEVGASVPLHYEVLGAPIGEFRIVGDLTITAREDATTGTVLHGQLLATHMSELGGGMVRYAVEGLARTEGGSRQLLLELHAPDAPNAPNYEVIITYDPDALRIAAAWIRKVSGDSKWLFHIHDHQHDEAVGDPGDPDHQAARAALEQIAETLGDSSFASDGEAALFPELAPSEPKIEIRAKHDWVVFHARHRRECAPPMPVEVVEPNRVYRIHAAQANSPALADKAQKLLLEQGANVGQTDLVEVGDVEFAPGVAKLLTSEAALAALWRPHGEQRRLAWVEIAFRGAPVAEGGAIAEGRALAVDRVVDDISPAVDTKRVTVRAGIPPALGASGLDGVIVLLTVPATICHSVYWIPPRAELGGLDQLIEQGNWDASLVRHLADVQFADGVLAPAQATLLSDAADLQLGVASSRIIDEVVTTIVAGSEHTLQTAVSHRMPLLAAVKEYSLRQYQAREVEHNPSGCELATFLLPRARKLSIYLVDHGARSKFEGIYGNYLYFDLASRLVEAKAQLIADVMVAVTSDKVFTVTVQGLHDAGLGIASACYAFRSDTSYDSWLWKQTQAAVASVFDVAPATVSVSYRYSYTGTIDDDDVVIVVFTDG